MIVCLTCLWHTAQNTATGSPTWSGWTSVGTEPFAGVRPEGKAVKAQGKARLDTR
jgi:hypothetical protein